MARVDFEIFFNFFRNITKQKLIFWLVGINFNDGFVNIFLMKWINDFNKFWVHKIPKTLSEFYERIKKFIFIWRWKMLTKVNNKEYSTIKNWVYSLISFLIGFMCLCVSRLYFRMDWETKTKAIRLLCNSQIRFFFLGK